MMQSDMARFIAVQGRGTIALPPDLRKRYGLDVPGAQVEVVERDDGVIELRPHVPIPVFRLSAKDSLFLARLLTEDAEPVPALRAAVKRASRASSASRMEKSRAAPRRATRS